MNAGCLCGDASVDTAAILKDTTKYTASVCRSAWMDDPKHIPKIRCCCPPDETQ